MSRALGAGALLGALLAVGCARDSYLCTSDADCDLGEAGRCEADGRCTAWDATCPTRHRYTPHSGELSGVCFDDRIVPRNACADGQPPARPEGCFADVCAALPACCTTGWSSACVAQAQLHCEFTCTTQIALTASRGATTELWELAWTGSTWTPATQGAGATSLAWIAPPPGAESPRRVQLATGAITIDDELIPLDPARKYEDATTVDLARDGRDTLVLSSSDLVDTTLRYLDVFDLASGAQRTYGVSVSHRVVWGDYDHDAFPDPVVHQAARYDQIVNVEADDLGRDLGPLWTTSVSGGNTPGAQQIRSVEWADVTGDGVLDLVASGNSLRIHYGADRLRDVPEISYDCDPPQPANSCAATSEASALATAVVPSASGTQLLVATFPRRALYVGAPAASGNLLTLTEVPLPACTTCPAFVAFVVRDLDDDQILDVTAIDANLVVWTRRSRLGSTFVPQSPIGTMTMNFQTVRLSVTGVPQ